MSGFAGHPRLEVEKGKLSRIWIGVVVLMMFVTWSYCLKETMAFIYLSNCHFRNRSSGDGPYQYKEFL